MLFEFSYYLFEFSYYFFEFSYFLHFPIFRVVAAFVSRPPALDLINNSEQSGQFSLGEDIWDICFNGFRDRKSPGFTNIVMIWG